MVVTTGSERQLDRELSEEFLRNVTSWQEMLIRSNIGINLVDLRLIDLHPIRNKRNPFRQQSDVTDWLRDFKERIPTEIEAGQVLAARTNGLLAYSHALGGVRFPIESYLSDTVGIRAEGLVGNVFQMEGRITMLRQKAAERFADLGFSFNEAGWRRYRQAEVFSPEAVEMAARDPNDQLVPIVLEEIDRVDLPLDFRTRVVTVDGPWINRIVGGPRQFRYEINTHPRNEFRYYRGMMELLKSHEKAAHLIQALCLRENLEQEQLDLSCGITTIPGIEQFAMEGMAVASPFLIPRIYDSMTDFGRFAVDYNYLYNLVLNKMVLILANTPNVNDTTLAQHIKDNLLGIPDEEIPNMINLRKNNPRYRSYYYCYGDSAEYLREAAESLPDEKRKSLVKYLYNNLSIPNQIETYVEQLKTT